MFILFFVFFLKKKKQQKKTLFRNFYRNQLSGSIPVEISSLSALTYLYDILISSTYLFNKKKKKKKKKEVCLKTFSLALLPIRNPGTFLMSICYYYVNYLLYFFSNITAICIRFLCPIKTVSQSVLLRVIAIACINVVDHQQHHQQQ